jgi:hypothetical protein
VVRRPDIAEEPVRKEVALPYDVQIHHVLQQAFAAMRCRANGYTIALQLTAYSFRVAPASGSS